MQYYSFAIFTCHLLFARKFNYNLFLWMKETCFFNPMFPAIIYLLYNFILSNTDSDMNKTQTQPSFKVPIEIIPRVDWGAREPKEIEKLLHPVPKIILHHSLMGGNNCVSIQDEMKLVKKIQDFHMDNEDRKWSDIGYSYAFLKFFFL